jgi:uncharacterized damage-inducible protein DinB
MAYSIETHLTYNHWANQQFANIVNQVDDAIVYRDNHSSFPSIYKTLVHIWDAQVIWIKRIHGESLRAPASSGFQGTKTEMLDELVKSSVDLLDVVKTHPEDFLTGMLTYKNLKGDTWTDSVEDILFHVVNHSTYHRGQVVTMLREAGVTQVVSTDLIHYLRSVRK